MAMLDKVMEAKIIEELNDDNDDIISARGENTGQETSEVLQPNDDMAGIEENINDANNEYMEERDSASLSPNSSRASSRVSARISSRSSSGASSRASSRTSFQESFSLSRATSSVSSPKSSRTTSRASSPVLSSPIISPIISPASSPSFSPVSSPSSSHSSSLASSLASSETSSRSSSRSSSPEPPHFSMNSFMKRLNINESQEDDNDTPEVRAFKWRMGWEPIRPAQGAFEVVKIYEEEGDSNPEFVDENEFRPNFEATTPPPLPCYYTVNSYEEAMAALKPFEKLIRNNPKFRFVFSFPYIVKK